MPSQIDDNRTRVKPLRNVRPSTPGKLSTKAAINTGLRLRSRSEIEGIKRAPTTPAIINTPPAVPAWVVVKPLNLVIPSIQVGTPCQMAKTTKKKKHKILLTYSLLLPGRKKSRLMLKAMKKKFMP